jgi:hypothetical protein
MHNATSTQRRFARLALAACAATVLVGGAPAVAHAAPEPAAAPALPTDGLLDTAALSELLGLDLGTTSSDSLPAEQQVTQNDLGRIIGQLGNGLSLPV